jgi:hypothetical protein
VLVAFDGLEDEAERVAEDEYQRLGNLRGNELWDMADAAEHARELGLAHYELLVGIKQGILNLFASSLYHLYEQQLQLFHRRHVLYPSEENEPKLFAHKEIAARLSQRGINLSAFNSWPKVQELRIVANTVKHAEGDSAEQLRQLRPELLVPPTLRLTRFASYPKGRSVFTPLLGHDLYVSLDDLREYSAALQCFWRDFADVLSSSSRPAPN